AIEKRHKGGKKFTILAVAEGAIPKKIAEKGKKEQRKAMEKMLEKYPSVSYKLAQDITERTGYEVRVTVPGHVQRGGSPDPFDRILSTKLGVYCAQLIMNNEFGCMVATVNNKIVKVPLEESAGKLKMVDPEDQTVKLAKYMGISFGD
ncbi:MAG: 6-phosphofructokinase, partial [Lachnospiraceae bacterium]|nr:6-phosphofructokinase [Lachnospiraceae bacterium]